jgi:hypothetical protein
LTDELFAAAFVMMSLVFVLPLCVSGPIPNSLDSLSFGIPRIHSGDEPHFLVMVNSMINDHDSDLRNNYDDVHAGDKQAGVNFAGSSIDHQVTWYTYGKLVRWTDVYETEPGKWQKDSEFTPIPVKRAAERHHPLPAHEYSKHPLGLALLLSPFVVWFRGTDMVEPACLICSEVFMVASLIFWCWLVSPFAANRKQIIAAAVMAYFGSPLWHYGRTLFPEPYLTFFCVAAMAFALRAERYLLSGILIACGVLIEPAFGVISIPLIIDTTVREERVDAISLAAPLVLAYGLICYWNLQQRGGYFRFPDQWEFQNWLVGVYGLTVSWRHGLLLSCPLVAIAVLVIPKWFREHERDAAVILISSGLYFVVMSTSAHWDGGACYSARLLVPIIPLILAPLPMIFQTQFFQSHISAKLGLVMLVLVSVEMSAIAAFACQNIWGRNPIELIL